MADLSAADIGALMGGRSGMGAGIGAGAGVVGGLLGGLLLGGLFNGGFGFGNRGWGPQAGNFATSNEVQNGFDNQNQMANQREILTAVNNVGAQSIATTNQTFHDTLNVLQDKYNEITRDIAAVQVSQAQALANQNQCCCDTKLLITENNALTNANIAQSRYDAALATANTNAAIAAGFADLKQTMAQEKIESLNNRIAQLELAQATSSVVRYPTMTTYNSGCNPFCNCGCGVV